MNRVFENRRDVACDPEVVAEGRRKTKRNRRAEVRAKILSILGSKCVCCGEDDSDYLEVDHVNEDGAQERAKDRTLFDSFGIYARIKKLLVPTDVYQLLCCNCHGAKSRGLICKHIRAEVAIEALGF